MPLVNGRRLDTEVKRGFLVQQVAPKDKEDTRPECLALCRLANEPSRATHARVSTDL